MQLSQEKQHEFLETLWGFYSAHGRNELPWRQPGVDGSFDPYKVLVSELMLQQTQVSRVIPKYEQFLRTFPDIQSLAAAELGDVLREWQGLGYNRRAKFLCQAAQVVNGMRQFPNTIETLKALPGVGRNTAGAIMAYAYNQPMVFIETNVRTVYIHHFLEDRNDVHDREIIELVEQTLDNEQPREFYWALMDYGSHLKATIGNVNRASKHYIKQSAFHGSRRQIRGAVLRYLSDQPQTATSLGEHITDDRLASVLTELTTEGLVQQSADGIYHL